MQDKIDRHPVSATVNPPKQIGSYLLEAGLLTNDQIRVILNDQQATGMRFGEIVVARGWMKEQTIEWIVEKVVEPERKLHQKLKAQPVNNISALEKPQTPQVSPSPRIIAPATSANAKQTFTRRDLPISKPLPSVNSSDNDVNWVG